MALCALTSAQVVSEPLEYRGRVGFESQKERIQSFLFADGGKRLVIVGKKNVQQWNTDTRALISSVQHELKNLNDWDVMAQIDPDGERAVVVDTFTWRMLTKKKVPAVVMDVKTGKQIATLEGQKEAVRWAEWSSNGETLVTFSHAPPVFDVDAEVCFWNGPDLKLRSCTSIKGDFMWQRLSRDGSKLFGWFFRTVQGGSRTIGGLKEPVFIYWNTESGLVAQTLRADSEISWRAVSPDESLFTGNDLGGLAVWNIGGSNAAIFRISPRNDNRSVRILGYTADSKHLIVYQPDAVEFYSTKTGKLDRSLQGIRSDSRDLFLLNPDNTSFAVAGCEDASFYDLETGRLLYEIDLVCKTEVDLVSTSFRDFDVFRFHPSGRYLLTASDKTLRLWDARSGENVQVVVAPERAEANRKDPNKDDGLTWEAGWIRDGKYLYAQAADGRSIHIWELVRRD